MGDHEGTLQNEYDGVSIKTKLVLTRLGSTFGTLRFDEKSFFNTFLGFIPFLDYKPSTAIHADSPGVYISEKFAKLSTKDRIHLTCDVNDGSVVNGIRQPILFSFLLGKPLGNKKIL